jgi:tetrahydromethanopterin S-methyltransferase subunit E
VSYFQVWAWHLQKFVFSWNTLFNTELRKILKGMILIIYLISMKVNVIWENITSKKVRGGSTDLERENVRKYSCE